MRQEFVMLKITAVPGVLLCSYALFLTLAALGCKQTAPHAAASSVKSDVPMQKGEQMECTKRMLVSPSRVNIRCTTQSAPSMAADQADTDQRIYVKIPGEPSYEVAAQQDPADPRTFEMTVAAELLPSQFEIIVEREKPQLSLRQLIHL
jgi:hypothetical protein